MSTIPAGSKVLVTGANGFYGSWVSKLLLDRGYSVRGTTRTAAKGEDLAKALNHPNFEYAVVGDILKPGAFDEAVKDVDGIIHTAAPIAMAEGDPEAAIAPAVKGTQSILESAKTHGNRLKRIVATSSVSSVVYMARQTFYKYTEADWNEHCVKEIKERGKDASTLAKYNASKTLAERAFWDFAEANKDSISFDFVTVLPSVTWGPVVLPLTKLSDTSDTMMYLWNYVKNPAADASTFTNYFANTVDIRDVSELHVEALLRPAAAGHRFLFGPYPMYPQFIYDVVNRSEALKARGITAPEGTPGATIPPPLEFDNTPARTILGITPRPIEPAIVEALTLFADAGLLP
ncbi:methylglyoxal reductase (NADPH-dependent) gre2 [Tulasnella sp. 424]|nr:methylglyoxal reductase (NADPH-dependent) gre2 [Tulasnella sp. 424]KAG8973232.1 methylglyoxal reductase (NADPH-dependent) gre2 [Tulasnella sp. 425]